MIQNTFEGFNNCEDPIPPEEEKMLAPPDPQRQQQQPKTDRAFDTEFGFDDSRPPPAEASQSTWTNWILPILTAPSKAVGSFFSKHAYP